MPGARRPNRASLAVPDRIAERDAHIDRHAWRNAGLMLASAGGGLGVATVFAMICFVALATGVFDGRIAVVTVGAGAHLAFEKEHELHV